MLFLDDLEARALECGAAGRRQLGRLEARDGDAPASPEGGVDEYGKVPSSELLRDSLHPGDVVPVTVAEHDRLDVSRQDLEPAHVLDDTGRRHARVEEDRPLATAGRDANERREARLGDQGIGQAVVGEQLRLRAASRDGETRSCAPTCCVGKSSGSVTLSIRIVIRTASTGASGIVTIA